MMALNRPGVQNEVVSRMVFSVFPSLTHTVVQRIQGVSRYRHVGRVFIGVASALIFAVPCFAQVNIEQHRTADEGMTVALDASFSVRSGNSDLYDIAAGGRLQHQSGQHTILAVARIRYGENDGTRYASSSFGHLRYTHWLTDRIGGEVFGQLERDRFTLLQLRALVGAGARLRVATAKHLDIIYGSSMMVEFENLDESRVSVHPATSEVVRWSNYVSFRWEINKRSVLSSTVYAQPRVDRFSDVRLLHDAAFEVGITEAVSLRVALRQRFDNGPPDNLKKHDLFVENGIRVRL
jgi:putative salt-induced outer membrane protein YdiY